MLFAGNLQQMFVLHLFYFSLLKTIVLFLKTLPLHCKHFYFKTKCWSPLHPILLMDYLLKIAFKSKICSGLDKWLVVESQVVKKTGRGIFPLAVRGRKSSIQASLRYRVQNVAFSNAPFWTRIPISHRTVKREN